MDIFLLYILSIFEPKMHDAKMFLQDKINFSRFFHVIDLSLKTNLQLNRTPLLFSL